MGLQLELDGGPSEVRREALLGKIARAAARLRVRAGRVAREEAPPRGQDALAAANYRNHCRMADDMAAVRASVETVERRQLVIGRKQLVLGRQLLVALVSAISCGLLSCC